MTEIPKFEDEATESAYITLCIARQEHLYRITKGSKYSFKNTGNSLKKYNEALEGFIHKLFDKNIGELLDNDNKDWLIAVKIRICD